MIEEDLLEGHRLIREYPAILQEKIVRGAIAVLGIFLPGLACYIMVATESNPLASAVKMAAPLAFLIAWVRPKTGLMILVVACCYLDLVKRVGYWVGFYGAGNQGLGTLQLDILSFAPITLVGIFCGIITQRIFRTKRLFERREWPFMFFILAANAIILLAARSTGSTLSEIATQVSGETLYTLLILIVPVLFTTELEILKFIRFILIVFLPCALYGIWQGVFGFTDVDYAWMKSGLTITSALLDDVKARAFGTLASPHPYSVLYWFVLLAGFLYFREKKGRVLMFAAGVINGGGLFFGYVRGAWVSLFVTIIAYFCFKKRTTTLAFYLVSVLAFAFLVKYGQFLLDHLEEYQSALPITSDSSGMAFRLGTFSDRLFGLRNWTSDSRLWSWFGRPDLLGRSLDSDEGVHDMLGFILVRYGAVGLLGGFVCAVFGLFKAHQKILGIADIQARSLASMLLAMVAVNFITAGMGGPNYGVFPWNFFIWLLVGFLIVLCRRAPGTTSVEEPRNLRSRIPEPNLSARPARRNPAFMKSDRGSARL